MLANNYPLVSVCVTTYFHEKYLAQALDSILCQKTNFNYEICISDDASSDKTVEILKKYESEYNCIRLNLNKTNVGLTKNFFIVYCMARGKYIVDLSGDDYYVDDCKLQKQVDFLENNPSYSGVATIIEARVDNEKKSIGQYPESQYYGRDFTLKMFMRGHNYPLNGIMVHNYWLTHRDEMKIMIDASEYIDDLTTCIKYLQKGNVYILPEICTVYRVHSKNKNNHNFNSINNFYMLIQKHIDNLNYLHVHLKVGSYYYRYKRILKSAYDYAIKTHSFDTFYNIYKHIPFVYKIRFLLLAIMLDYFLNFIKGKIISVRIKIKQLLSK